VGSAVDVEQLCDGSVGACVVVGCVGMVLPCLPRRCPISYVVMVGGLSSSSCERRSCYNNKRIIIILDFILN